MEKMNLDEIKDFLDEKVIQYNVPGYIDTDPIQIPHQYNLKEDIEIAAFLTATIAWGQRSTIIKNADSLMQGMIHSPYDFIMNAGKTDISRFSGFVHRTFNGEDCAFYIRSLQNIYRKYGGFDYFFNPKLDLIEKIMNLRDAFFEIDHPVRTQKHFPDIRQGSAAKRFHMFLRWMVRRDKSGVDFGIWKHISPAELYIPLDVHVGNVARKLGILKRKQNDWKAVLELMKTLRQFDPVDPVKYDYALFGLGVFEKFSKNLIINIFDD